MKISGYRFGEIDIGGTTYRSDVIVLPESVRDQWWRKEGHSLHTEDLTAVVDAKPDLVILGTGYYGNMTIPAATRNFLESKGIEVRVAKTGQAVEEFNALQQQYARVVAALHLTC